MLLEATIAAVVVDIVVIVIIVVLSLFLLLFLLMLMLWYCLFFLVTLYLLVVNVHLRLLEASIQFVLILFVAVVGFVVVVIS